MFHAKSAETALHGKSAFDLQICKFQIPTFAMKSAETAFDAKSAETTFDAKSAETAFHAKSAETAFHGKSAFDPHFTFLQICKFQTLHPENTDLLNGVSYGNLDRGIP